MSNFKKITLSKSAFLGPNFSPTNVPEVAAGYWWSATGSTGFGTTNFRVIEQNGHSSFDLIQSTVASQPTLLFENGGVQFRMRKAGDSNPSFIATSSSVVAGWTGSTYFAGWFRLPNASGVITGNGQLFSHGIATGSQLRISITLTVASGITGILSADGAATNNNAYVNPFNGSWQWVELFCPDSTGVSSATCMRLFINFVEIVRSGGGGTITTSIANSSSKLGIGCRVNNILANVDTTDWTTAYYTNGIPSLENRKRLANYFNPLGVLFT